MVGPSNDTPGSTLGVRELRNQVAQALRRAESGERLVITVDGRPVCQLAPLAPLDGDDLRHEDLVATGLLEAPRRARPPSPDPETLPVDLGLARLLDETRGRS